MKPRQLIIPGLVLLATGLAQAQLTPEQIQKLPAPTARTVQFTKDIQPLLEASCIKCHAKGKSKGEAMSISECVGRLP